jgi:DNA helicase HerA-like ATPase
MRDDVRAAVLANAATVVAFRTGAEDAQVVARVLGDLKPSALAELRRGEAWIRTAPATAMPMAHSVKTYAPIATYSERGDLVRRYVRNRHTTSRHTVEQRINSWLERHFGM